MIVKANLNDKNQSAQSIDDLMIKRKNVRKMYVSRNGNHCILLAEHEIFYNHWSDNQMI